MYCERTRFISKMLVAVLAWATSALLRAGSVDGRRFQWYLRPHHEAADFQPLLKLAREAFNACAAGHVTSCKLWEKMPLVVVDGKWSTQTPLCARLWARLERKPRHWLSAGLAGPSAQGAEVLQPAPASMHAAA